MPTPPRLGSKPGTVVCGCGNGYASLVDLLCSDCRAAMLRLRRARDVPDLPVPAKQQTVEYAAYLQRDEPTFRERLAIERKR